MNHFLNLRSAAIENGSPKLPATSGISYGEIAINYADGYETISIKNNSSEIVKFSSDDYYTSEKLGSGFTGVNSGNTVTDIIEGRTKASVVAITSNYQSHCSISATTEYSNYAETIIYTNSTSTDYIITIPTAYNTPNGANLTITCPAGGYCEVSYLNINGVIYARGL